MSDTPIDNNKKLYRNAYDTVNTVIRQNSNGPFEKFLNVIDLYSLFQNYQYLTKYDTLVEYKCYNNIVQFWKNNDVYGIAHNDKILCKSAKVQSFARAYLVNPICYYIEQDGSYIMFNNKGILDIGKHNLSSNLTHTITLYSMNNMLATNFNIDVDEVLLFNLYHVHYIWRNCIKSNTGTTCDIGQPFKSAYIDYIDDFRKSCNVRNYTNEMLVRHLAALDLRKQQQHNK